MKSAKRDSKFWAKFLVLFTVYLVTAKLGLQLEAISGFATLVWLPTGISLAALLLWGTNYWPAISAAAFVANFSSGAPPLVATGMAAGNTLEAIVAAYGLNKFFKFKPTLDRVSDVLGLIFIAALLSTLISATVGTTFLLLGKEISASSYLVTWRAWWTGDMISNLIIAPLILVWSKKPKIDFRLRRLSEQFISMSLLCFAALMIFRNILTTNSQAPIIYLVFPPLIWLSLRFSQRASSTAMFILSSIAIWSTVQGLGPFSGNDLSQNLFYLQGFMGITAITIMLLTASAIERKDLERKKDEFIAIASHELRTPLTSMKLFGEIIEKNLEKRKYENSFSYVKKVNQQINRLSRLVLELLDTSRIQRGEINLRKEQFSLYKLIESIVEEIIPRGNIIFGKKNNIKINADKERIAQVILNLLSNAIKYSPLGKKIIVTMTNTDGKVTVGVQDFGKGVPKDDQQRIFERFYQVKKDADRKGLGLGLYIAKEIIERHKGTIWVESKPKAKGATFYFKLPIKDYLS